MDKANKRQVVRLISELNVDECKNVLNKNINVVIDFDEFYGKVNNYKFWVMHRDIKYFGVRYFPPKFEGEIIKTENGTIIQGAFGSQLSANIFEKVAAGWVTVIGAIIIIEIIKGIFTGESNIQGGHPMLLLIILIIVIFTIIKFTKFSSNLRYTDKEKIISLLQDKLNAKTI